MSRLDRVYACTRGMHHEECVFRSLTINKRVGRSVGASGLGHG